MQLVDVVGEQMGPFESLPVPNRCIDVNAARMRQLLGLGIDAGRVA